MARFRVRRSSLDVYKRQDIHSFKLCVAVGAVAAVMRAVLSKVFQKIRTQAVLGMAVKGHLL